MTKSRIALLIANSMWLWWGIGLALEVVSPWYGASFWVTGVAVICVGSLAPSIALYVLT
jgi:hypothetical protein